MRLDQLVSTHRISGIHNAEKVTILWRLLTRISVHRAGYAWTCCECLGDLWRHSTGVRLDQLVESTHEDLWHTPCRRASLDNQLVELTPPGSMPYTVEEKVWTNLPEFTYQDLWHTEYRRHAWTQLVEPSIRVSSQCSWTDYKKMILVLG
ncbi:hypothetical protein RRG08_066588 [Elysia crispata]|uniref:Uncharacterized protein n=1 Tax=Elysia crispata TaxID=231223 RepID=A0AAE1ATT3_9GAST|nr:hypothetical protein RRG08_066588 [Elysia crispata]